MTEAGYFKVLLDKKDTKITELESDITKFRIEYEKQIVKLQKENAELKADNDARKFAMAMSEKVEQQLRTEINRLKERETEAKVIIDKFFDFESSAMECGLTLCGDTHERAVRFLGED